VKHLPRLKPFHDPILLGTVERLGDGKAVEVYWVRYTDAERVWRFSCRGGFARKLKTFDRSGKYRISDIAKSPTHFVETRIDGEPHLRLRMRRPYAEQFIRLYAGEIYPLLRVHLSKLFWSHLAQTQPRLLAKILATHQGGTPRIEMEVNTIDFTVDMGMAWYWEMFEMEARPRSLKEITWTRDILSPWISSRGMIRHKYPGEV